METPEKDKVNHPSGFSNADKIREMEMYLKVHRRKNEIIVAACDKEILGKKFSEGEFQLEVNRGFYCGELMDIRGLPGALGEATIANLTGNNVVNSALDQCLISDENVLEIAGIKHAQVVILL